VTCVGRLDDIRSVFYVVVWAWQEAFETSMAIVLVSILHCDCLDKSLAILF
jgi:hypothetical protein